MTTSLGSRVTGLTFTVALSIGLVACGGGSGKDNSPQAKAFCAVSGPVKALAGVLENEDITKTKAAFEAADTALSAVAGNPPSKIAADVATIKSTYTAANDALKKAGYDPGKVDKASAPAVNALEDQAFVKAGDNVAAWTKENC
jgi:hypothetical protein